LWESHNRWAKYESSTNDKQSTRREMMINHKKYDNDWNNTEYKLTTPHNAVEVCAKWHPNWNTRKKFSEILVLL